MRSAVAPLLLASLAATASGCSFVAVRRPPKPPPDAALECTESRAAPVADTVGAALTAFVGLVAYPVCLGTVSAATQAAPGDRECAPVAVAAAAVTATYVASAIYGYRSTGECRRLQAERRALPPAPARPAPVTGTSP
jgi:hypothetical protein